MEPAQIDWTAIESIFVEDKDYEHIRAPKWVDFSNPDKSIVDDKTFFCRPDCRHPTTPEDFLNSTPTSQANFSSSAQKNQQYLHKTISGNPNLKKGGFVRPERFEKDGENQNPNIFSTPQHVKPTKPVFGSNSEKKKKKTAIDNNSSLERGTPWLKTTMSARNLFTGKEIVNHITEFCNDLKKMATKTKDERFKATNEVAEREILDELMKEKKPLLFNEEVNSETVKKKENEEKIDPVHVDVKNIVKRIEERSKLLQIQTNPPSPQYFPNASKATPLKASRCRPPPERGILQEIEYNKKTETKIKEGKNTSNISIAVEENDKTIDILWFLKPCRLSS